MPHGGKRKGAGRKPGIPNRRALEERLRALDEAKESERKLVELIHGADSETVLLNALKEHLNRKLGRARAARLRPVEGSRSCPTKP